MSKDILIRSLHHHLHVLSNMLLCSSTHRNDCAMGVWEKNCCCFKDLLIGFVFLP